MILIFSFWVLEINLFDCLRHIFFKLNKLTLSWFIFAYSVFSPLRWAQDLLIMVDDYDSESISINKAWTRKHSDKNISLWTFSSNNLFINFRIVIFPLTFSPFGVWRFYENCWLVQNWDVEKKTCYSRPPLEIICWYRKKLHSFSKELEEITLTLLQWVAGFSWNWHYIIDYFSCDINPVMSVHNLLRSLHMSVRLHSCNAWRGSTIWERSMQSSWHRPCRFTN